MLLARHLSGLAVAHQRTTFRHTGGFVKDKERAFVAREWATTQGLMGDRKFYGGDEAQCKRGSYQLKLFHPIVRREVHNWEDLEKVWRHTYENELRVVPGERKVLLTESAAWGAADRERALQMQFESFGVSAAYLSVEVVLVIHTAGRQTGVVVDSGMATRAVAVLKIAPNPPLARPLRPSAT